MSEFSNLPWLAVTLICAGAYLLGSIPFGYLIVMLVDRRDIRAAGSGNIGAANVTRTVGAAAGVLTLLLDAAKGFAAVWAVAWLTASNVMLMMVAAVAAIVGHLFPVWLRFKGGKGVATGAGAIGLICWPAVAASFGIWIVVVAIWRYVSLGSMAAAAALPMLAWWLYTPQPAPLAVSIGTSLAAVLIILKHHENIRRIVAGNENRLSFKKKV